MRSAIAAFVLVAVAAFQPLAAGPVDGLLDGYRAAGAGPFSAEAGERLWNAAHEAPDGDDRHCTDCHGSDLTAGGRHRRTGKAIKPMAPSANPERLTDDLKIEKWFYRNCKWTLGRVCTPQEKGDLLTFLRSQ